MQINLSNETIETVRKALISKENSLKAMLQRIENGTASKEKEETFKTQLAKVEDALSVFEELE